MKFLQKIISDQLSKFVFFGGITTVIHFCILHVLFVVFGFPVWISNSVAFIFAASFSYWANYSYTFNSRQDHAQAYPRFITSVCLGFLLNAYLMHVFVVAWQFDYRLAFILITGLVMISNFALNKFWVFK